MNKLSLTLSAALIAATAGASTVHTLRGEAFDVDTIAHYKCGPGMTHTTLHYQSQTRSAKHFNANVITFDMPNATGLDFRMHLGRDSVHTTERMTAVAARHNNASNQYVAAINGDFFITWSATPGMLGYPNMTACADGQMALSDNVDQSHHLDAFIMDRQGGMWCDQTQLQNTVTWADGTSTTLYGVNFARRDNAYLDAEDDSSDVVFYNSHRGHYTGSAQGWREVTVALADGAKWSINSPVDLVVTSACRTGGHSAIPADGGVIAAASAASVPIESLQPGDHITLNLGMTLPRNGNISPDVKEVVGGDVALLLNGEPVLEANRFINSRDGEYPRTMVGYDTSRSKMVWCVVDGKTTTNTGCTYPQGAEMMKYYGCVDAVNFDGGGSTMMWLQKPGIVNAPSDGSERAVASGLFAVIEAPADNTIAEIRFLDWSKSLPQYGEYTPVIYGYNSHGQLIDTDVKGFTLDAPAELGHVVNDGLTLMVDGTGCHKLTARLGDLEASIPVNAAPAAQITMAYDRLLIDNIHPLQLKVYAPVDGGQLSLSPQALTWECDNPQAVQLDEYGQIVGLADGVATVTASVGGMTASTAVTVECPTARLMDIQNPIVIDNWSVKATSATATLSALGQSGLAVDYNVSSTRSPTVTITPTGGARLWSIPDALQLTVKPVGGTLSKATVTLLPNGGRNTTTSSDALTTGIENSITLPLSGCIDTSDPSVYPVTLVSIGFSIKEKTEARIEIPQIATLYDSLTGIADSPIGTDDPAVTDASARAVYYNLQGMAVSHPARGQFYIVVRGSKVSKEIY